jgi:TatD DNase family protein
MSERFVDVHTHARQDGKAGHIRVVNATVDSFPEDVCRHEYLSLGIHPWKVREGGGCERRLRRLVEWAGHEKVVAIGECGLDRLTEGFPTEQEALFRKQLELAEGLGKPLIIHCVRAHGELIWLKKALKLTVPVVVHGYNGNERITAELLKNGCHLSFGKALLHPQSAAARQLATLPVERFFLETDDSGLPIEAIYRAAAGLRGVAIEELREDLYTNFRRVFMPSVETKP